MATLHPTGRTVTLGALAILAVAKEALNLTAKVMAAVAAVGALLAKLRAGAAFARAAGILATLLDAGSRLDG